MECDGIDGRYHFDIFSHMIVLHSLANLYAQSYLVFLWWVTNLKILSNF